jgi:hypothetical protein
LLNCAVQLHGQLCPSRMSADADADNKHNNATNKLTNNHADVWNVVIINDGNNNPDNKHNDATNNLTNNHVDVDIVNDGNNDSDDFRSDRQDNVD